MKVLTQTIIFVAMVILTIVSMWTTYVSLHDSILPEPAVNIPLGDYVWECSVFALALSVAIGLMLFALKMAIIDEQKRLSITGIIGLTVVAFISISFNMDVLYRTADHEFFLDYSSNQVTRVYEEHLANVQTELVNRRDGLLKDVARQKGELEAEIRGIRQAPAGYGQIAKQEDYNLTLLEKEVTVAVNSIEEALLAMEQANEVLRTTVPTTIDEIEQLQNELRVLARDAGVAAGLPLPEPVQTESPLFAVFAKLFDLKSIGIKELFFLAIALFLDLGDIVGYTLVPSGRPKKRVRGPMQRPTREAEKVEHPSTWFLPRARVEAGNALPEIVDSPAPLAPTEEDAHEHPPRRPFKIGR